MTSRFILQDPAKSDSSRLKQVLAKPLIVGASVSADWLAPSPGRLLAEEFTDKTAIRNLAQGGKPSIETLKSLEAATLAPHSIVIGIDLFFWDAMLPSPERSLALLQKLMGFARLQGIPIVLGEIPLLLPGIQRHAAILNKALHEAAARYSQAVVMPFTTMLMKVLSQGGLSFEGETHSLKDLIPDGLHIGNVASRYIAHDMRQRIEPVLT